LAGVLACRFHRVANHRGTRDRCGNDATGHTRIPDRGRVGPEWPQFSAVTLPSCARVAGFTAGILLSNHGQAT
jgi:hypothetical protein